MRGIDAVVRRRQGGEIGSCNRNNESSDGRVNPYERFHAHLPVAVAMALFDIADPQIIDLVTEEHVRYDKGLPQHDREMYAALSSVEPIIATHGSDRDSTNVTFEAIESALVDAAPPPLFLTCGATA